ncbi:SseB family protein [Nocardioides mangrovi]|uniref:SseB family protein n=1 Tax=Nocardioides mangrovi TaxID=2874580 RepID=A0ABS7UK18_9ACTN|nr:SseB family protein [Nocardioides mangrovi]MBZ5741122.1 SseB family protein [Nocardioides mangrovi]
MLEPDPTQSRVIPDPGFADDDGTAAPELAAALAAWDGDRSASQAYSEALAALQRSRLLVPVVAVLGEVEVDEAGLAQDKTSDMATVLLQGADGRLALLAFTGTASLAAWNPEGRPVPVRAELAAQSALQDGAAALVVDVAGPVRFVVEGDDLRRLAEGWTIARAGGQVVWIRPAAESSATLPC